MGTWGTAISSSDIFEDVKYEFFELYNEGAEPDQITKQLIEANQEAANSHEDSNNFWFAIGLCQWECKALQPELLTRITNIIESGLDIELWEELGSVRSELTKRQKALEKFLIKLNTEKKTAKKRKKKKYQDSIFKKGDCLSIQLSDMKFGAAFVLEAETQTEYGFNLIAICDYSGTQPPSADFFESASVLISKQQESPDSYEDDPLISWFMADQFNDKGVIITVVGSLSVSEIYNREGEYRSYVHWKFIPTHIENQPQLVEEHGAIKKTIKLKSLRTKKRL